MLTNPTPAIVRDANINPETLVADLRKRARLAHSLARRRGDHIDALYLEAAANEIERLLRVVAEADLVIIQVDNEEAQEKLCETACIQVIAEIEPHPDPVYGHTFPWPEEVEQFFALNP